MKIYSLESVVGFRYPAWDERKWWFNSYHNNHFKYVVKATVARVGGYNDEEEKISFSSLITNVWEYGLMNEIGRCVGNILCERNIGLGNEVLENGFWLYGNPTLN